MKADSEERTENESGEKVSPVNHDGNREESESPVNIANDEIMDEVSEDGSIADTDESADGLKGLSNRLMKLMADKSESDLSDAALKRMKALFQTSTALPAAQKIVNEEARKAGLPEQEIWNMTRGILENICSDVEFEFLRSRVIGDLFGAKGTELSEMSDQEIGSEIDQILTNLAQADQELVDRTARGLSMSMIQAYQADKSRRDSEKRMEVENGHLQKENTRLRKIANERAELVAVLKKDYENLKSRSREREESIQKNAAETVAMDLLPVMDSFGRALAQDFSGDEKLSGFIAGFAQISTQLKVAMQRHGVCEIECMGQEFDPEIHEAIVHLDTTDSPDNTIIDVVESGYFINEKILRHPKVVVARNKNSN
ncbi:MAG: nucleotide exchange factor GrpE [Candidatus Wallbacteria bacterium HGW-Wallbacteria-1]|jgi:molecular chaperone GrpE|uniref:Protein GrpE n=1 Tax=Candidatus Wallbacteria bacterium HGW-Wallbacteria-1 TaxID=2013854 RepID=A0A2N1PM48_9BACT|nr:MAG: nucleotide exchange factor GrpE [Candidatus Wallbacteria bacterium HGW-Wallbacteria-1]